MEYQENEIILSLTNARQDLLNDMRWAQFLSMKLPIAGKTIFEPGAGIGDQTDWLLKQDVKHITVSDGRKNNLEIIKNRFKDNPRVSTVHGDLETCLDKPEFQFTVDFIFCYGVYYHIKESYPEWHIMKGLARMGQTIALDYLTGGDAVYDYGYENPSTSISQSAFRPQTETLLSAMKKIWGYAYLPKNQLAWVDPVQAEERLIAVGSHVPLDGELIEWK